MSQDLIYRLRKRAEIRRGIAHRKSVQNGEPDRIADLLEEAANELERLSRIQCSHGRSLADDCEDCKLECEDETK